MKIEEAKKLVESSFLSDADKKKLEATLAAEGMSTSFFQLFNSLLIENTDARARKYRQLMADFDSFLVGLKEKFNRSKESIKSETELEIAALDAVNFKGKESVWDNYDKKIAKLFQEYESAMKECFSSLTKALF